MEKYDKELFWEGKKVFFGWTTAIISGIVLFCVLCKIIKYLFNWFVMVGFFKALGAMFIGLYNITGNIYGMISLGIISILVFMCYNARKITLMPNYKKRKIQNNKSSLYFKEAGWFVITCFAVFSAGYFIPKWIKKLIEHIPDNCYKSGYCGVDPISIHYLLIISCVVVIIAYIVSWFRELGD